MRFAHRIGTQDRLSPLLIQTRICAQQIVDASIFGGKVLESFMVRSVGIRFESRQLDKRQPMVQPHRSDLSRHQCGPGLMSTCGGTGAMRQIHAQDLALPLQHDINIGSAHTKMLQPGVDDRYLIHSV